MLMWILLALIIAGAYFYFFVEQQGPESREPNPQVLQAVHREIPAIHALVVQEDGDAGNRRMVQCEAGKCSVRRAPESIEGEALFDGENWYRYANAGDEARKRIVLERIDSSGAAHTITEENILVRPRDMIISVDGGKLAYFLDNISDAKGLTELWVYDSKEGGTRVVAEKLTKNNIASPVRWNASSRVAWFLQEEKKKQLTVVRMHGATAAAGFAHVDWNIHAKAAESGAMDINDDATLVAFAEESSGPVSKLFVAKEGGGMIQKSVKGTVVFLQWTQGDSLVYAVQDGGDISFWMANTEKEWPITRMAATFESARSVHASQGKSLAFVASPRNGETHVYVLQIESGNIKDEAIVPQFAGRTHLVQASASNSGAAFAQFAEHAISDSELIAFIEQHIQEISGQQSARLTRILVTDALHTCLVDYVDDAGQEQRIQVAIMDILHPEWRVLGRYTVVNGKWIRSEEGAGREPGVVRLYEWEEALSQWILKNTF